MCQGMVRMSVQGDRAADGAQMTQMASRRAQGARMTQMGFHGRRELDRPGCGSEPRENERP